MHAGIDSRESLTYNKVNSLHCIRALNGASATVQTEQAVGGSLHEAGPVGTGSRALRICGTVPYVSQVFFIWTREMP